MIPVKGDEGKNEGWKEIMKKRGKERGEVCFSDFV